MRKTIETKEAKNEVKPQTEGSETMENFLKFYAKFFKRMAYGKDADTDIKLLNYAECLQEAIVKYLDKKPITNNVKFYILCIAKNEMRNRYKKESTIVLEDDNFTQEIFASNLGQVVIAREAIEKTVNKAESNILSLYGQGFTLEEIASQLGLSLKSTHRTLKRAKDKVDGLRLSWIYNSKYATYQGKQGKADVKWNSDTIHKTDTVPGDVVKRRFACLDQSRPKVKCMPDNYSGDMVVLRKEAIVEIASDTDSTSYSFKMLNKQYMNSTFEPFENNKEVMQLFKNRVEYKKYLDSISTVVKEKRYEITFASGKYTSTDHKFFNIAAK